LRSVSVGAAVILLTIALAATGCSQRGVQAPEPEAAKLDVATSRISVACGYAEELTAFGGQRPPGLAWIDSIAQSGAVKLVGVFERNQTWIYQGESVGAIVHDSVSLLGDCGLPGARQVLLRALAQS
jgi:hypothetical protein